MRKDTFNIGDGGYFYHITSGLESLGHFRNHRKVWGILFVVREK